jgi:TolB-like protein
MKKLYLFFLLLMFIPSAAFAEEPVRIAVMDFKADGVSASIARQVSELVRTEIVACGSFEVIERKQVDLVLKEQGFQQSICIDEARAVKIGRIMSAQKLLIGTVMKIDTTYIVSARIVDIEKGTALFGEKATAENSSSLPDAATRLVRKLNAKINPGDAVAQSSSFNNDSGKPGRKQYSLGLAVTTSLLPVWSGSFNNGFDIVGFSFVGVKIVTMALGVKYGIDYSNASSDVNSYSSAIQGYDVGTVDYGNTALALAKDENTKKESLIWCATTLSLYGIVALVDCIYSYFIIDDFNRGGIYYAESKQKGDLEFDLYTCGNYNTSGNGQGLHALVRYYF